MASASGTSIRGLQTLINVSSAPSTVITIGITNQPLPPIRRVGYFYVYQYRNVTPFQCYVVLKGVVSAPGLWQRIPIPLFASDYLYRVDVVWNEPSIPWTVNVI